MWIPSFVILSLISRVLLWKVDHFVAKISGNSFIAKEISKVFGIYYFGEVMPGLNYYHFRIFPLHPQLRYVFSTNMFLDKRVHDVLPQIGRLRVLRKKHPSISGFVKESNKLYFGDKECAVMDMNFNDPFFPYQWYLEKKWMNVIPAWSEGLDGFGIKSVILDDGLYFENPDISPNYDGEVSYDVSGSWISHDPTPDLKNYIHNSHGTQCAAIISAAGNNSYCGVGIAFKAKVGGVKLLNGEKSHINDLQETLALQVAVTRKVDVVVSSWGPSDDGKTIGGPEKLAKQAILEGIAKGRNGRGAIFVWAVGNGGIKDNCNLDGYASSIYTVSISSLTKFGNPCVYNEPCSATLVSCYVGGKDTNDRNNLHLDYMVVPLLDGGCKNSFQGTSAAAPLAAGIVALMLQANENLTWRDVQHILIRSAKRPSNGYDWFLNGAGLYYNNFSGFGAIDTLKAVNLSRTWVGVPPQRNFTTFLPGLPRPLLPKSQTFIRGLVSSTEGYKKMVLEHTVLIISLDSTRRGTIELSLTSPSGTISHLLTERPLDDSSNGFNDWKFMSTHFWLEDPIGTWTVAVTNLSEDFAEIKNSRIIFYGYTMDFV